MDKIFLAARSDGLGSRLVAILNAFYIASRFGNKENVRFSWVNKETFCQDDGFNKNFRGLNTKIIGMSVEEEDRIFSRNFIEKYHIVESEINTRDFFYCKKKVNTLEEFLNIFRQDVTSVCRTDIGFLPQYLKDVELNDYRGICKQAWENIEFSDNLKKIIKDAQQKSQKLGDYVCIHVRSGDVIYDYLDIRKYHKSHVYHAVNAALALELIYKELGKNKIVIIGDDIDTTEKLVELVNHPEVYHINTQRSVDHFSNLELFMFDIIFMSNSKKLYGTYSAMIKIARMISETEFFSSYYQFKSGEYYEILKKNYNYLFPYISSSQNAFILFHLFLTGMELNEDVEILCSYLDKALEYDFENDKYRIYKIYCLLKYNKIDKAELFLSQYLSFREKDFISLLFYKNYAGSFSEVFPYFFSNAKSLYPYISYIAAQIYMYHRDYFMAYKIIKDIAYLNPSFINFSKKLAIKSYKYLNISLKNKDQLIKNQIVQIKELKNKVLQLQKDFDSINLLKNDLLEIQKKQLDVLIKDREQMIVNRFRYGKAKNRIQNQLSYKLGQAMIVNSKSLLGYIRMPFALSYIKDKHKQEQKIYQEKIKKDPSLKLPPLEDYPDYKEALKEKECLTYKLGEALIKASNNWVWGYIKLLLEIRKLKKEFKKK
ncbi:hypothetical protein ACLJ7P_000517 [Campylobacter coli]